MKRIISFIMIATLLFGLCACNAGTAEEIEQDEYEKAQMKVIEALNISVDKKRIVAFKGENDHLEYIVVEYDENVVKKNETTYYFCFNKSVYEKLLVEFADEPGLEKHDSEHYFTFTSVIANSGSYENDLKRIETEYRIK